ncbi:type II toxin-antitoxin system PemK/MazF family toxin [Pyramidobacter sp.]|uniref:type II toxin-antitoxin system PemK/MazF family toxin n=1 Tax=Pyramidobacter sp. TaxID=1943581 RepID=UPI002A7EF4A7|nr:type II toxin-antitoxin system PemK/MazF family toxin [Pyramidobacter sp.]
MVAVAVQGDYGKPGPALVIQADVFIDHTSITFLPLTSFLVEAPFLRYTILPDKENGLAKISQVMIDKVMTLPKEKVGKVIGRLSGKEMKQITSRLSLFIGIGEPGT